MPHLEKTDSAPRTHRLSHKASDRHISFHYADDASDHPDEPHVEIVVAARGGADPFRASRYVLDSALTKQEQGTLKLLLEKLVDAELSAAGYSEKP